MTELVKSIGLFGTVVSIRDNSFSEWLFELLLNLYKGDLVQLFNLKSDVEALLDNWEIGIPFCLIVTLVSKRNICNYENIMIYHKSECCQFKGIRDGYNKKIERCK